jgi:hypothetical protein
MWYNWGMPTWAWIVNPILWTISICLAGFSVWFILKGVRDLRRAKWSKYAENFEEFLDTAKNQGESYKEMIEGYNKMISDVEKILGGRELPPNLSNFPNLSNLVERLEKLQKGLEGVTAGYKKSLERQTNILRKLREFTNRGGLAGFSTLRQIDATKNIAIAAALMALSGIGFSISGIIAAIAG